MAKTALKKPAAGKRGPKKAAKSAAKKPLKQLSQHAHAAGKVKASRKKAQEAGVKVGTAGKPTKLKPTATPAKAKLTAKAPVESLFERLLKEKKLRQAQQSQKPSWRRSNDQSKLPQTPAHLLKFAGPRRRAA